MKLKKKSSGKKIFFGSLIISISVFVIFLINHFHNTTTEQLSKGEESTQEIAIVAGTPNTDNFTYVESKDGIQVPVPKRYRASSVEDELYVNGVTTEEVITDSETGEETTVYTREHSGGFVIYEGEDEVPEDESGLFETQKTRNQYVWVPISSEELVNMYHTSNNLLYGNYYNFTATGYSLTKSGTREPALLSRYDKDNTYLKQYMYGITQSQFIGEMRQKFYEMLKSSATYGGFYIGRYETGNLSKNVPVVRKMNTDIASQNWYRMYQRCKELSGGNGAVETNMIWGIQWDETLKWLIDDGEKTAPEIAADSTSWGNYYISTFTYKNTSGGTSTKNMSNSTKIPTGSADYTKANNIYDLAGNVWDWTMESGGVNFRYCHGGFYSYDGYDSPAHNRYYDSPLNSYTSIGCRAVLYIK